MTTRASELRLMVRTNDGTAADAVAYLDAVNFDVARRNVEAALHRLGLSLLAPDERQFRTIHLTNWLSYRAERYAGFADALPDQFELRNMLTKGEIFFVGLPGQKETLRYA